MTKTLHWVAMTGVLTAVMVVARLFVHPWPNVTPFTALVILVAWYFGWRIALPATSLAVILTGLLLGMHPVVMVQLFLYAGLVLLTCGSRHVADEKSMALIVGLVFCLTYGFWTTILQAPFLFGGFNWPAIWSYWLAGLSFDFAHCVTTFMCVMALFHPFSRMLLMYQKIPQKT